MSSKSRRRTHAGISMHGMREQPLYSRFANRVDEWWNAEGVWPMIRRVTIIGVGMILFLLLITVVNAIKPYS